MAERPEITEAQKYALGPWVVTLFASFGIALLSYAGLVAYLFIADEKQLWLIVLWVGATALGWRLASRHCRRQIDAIIGQTRGGKGDEGDGDDVEDGTEDVSTR